MRPAALEGSPSVSRHGWLVAIVLVCAVVAAFAPALRNGFVEVLDDEQYVTGNAHVRQGLTWEGVRWAFEPAQGKRTYWHPLTWLSLMADVQLFGVRAQPIHATNMMLHALAALLLFLALERMTGKPWRSAAVALLFAVHPVQVEAVAWAVERKTVLAGALGMGALLGWARYAERSTVGRYLAVLGLFAASLLAKPVFLTLPALLLVLDVWPLGRTALAAPERPAAEIAPASARRLVLEKLPFLAIAAAATLFVAGLSPDRDPAGLGSRLASAATAYWRYLAKVAWPSELSFFYPFPAGVPWWQPAVAAIGLVAVTAALAAARSRVGTGPLVGWSWFLGTMVPCTGIVRTGLWPHVADRFLYLPIVGLLLAAVWLVGAFVSSRPAAARAALAVAAAAACGFAVASHVQARRWGDPVVLFGSAAQAGPNRVALANLGTALRAQGRVADAKRVYEETIRLFPAAADGYVNLGLLLQMDGELAEAERLYRAALAKDPSCAEAHFDLGLVLRTRGDVDGSVRSFERAIASGFGSVGHVLLGVGYLSQGRPADAERTFRTALRNDPMQWHAGVHLGDLLAKQGRLAEARLVLLDARRRAVVAGGDPSPVDLVLARYALTSR